MQANGTRAHRRIKTASMTAMVAFRMPVALIRVHTARIIKVLQVERIQVCQVQASNPNQTPIRPISQSIAQ